MPAKATTKSCNDGSQVSAKDLVAIAWALPYWSYAERILGFMLVTRVDENGSECAYDMSFFSSCLGVQKNGLIKLMRVSSEIDMYGTGELAAICVPRTAVGAQ